MTSDTNPIQMYANEAGGDPYELFPMEFFMKTATNPESDIIKFMREYSGLTTHAELANMLGVSEDWLLKDYVNAYELLRMFCFLTKSELTIGNQGGV